MLLKDSFENQDNCWKSKITDLRYLKVRQAGPWKNDKMHKLHLLTRDYEIRNYFIECFYSNEYTFVFDYMCTVTHTLLVNNRVLKLFLQNNNDIAPFGMNS